MIALIFATGAGNRLNFTELAGDTIRAIDPVRKLAVVPKVAPAADGMLTVAQLCAARGVSLAVPCMSRIGRKAAALSRAGGLLIGRAVEPFGEVNTYDAGVLAQAFAAIEAAA